MDTTTKKPIIGIKNRALIEMNAAYSQMNEHRPKGEPELDYRSFVAGWMLARFEGVFDDN